MAIRAEVENYVLGLTNQPALDHSINLFESGLLSSLDVLDLIAFVEETYDIEISDDDIGMENFGTINGLVNYLERVAEKR